MDNQVLDWLVLNKSIQIYKQFLDKKNYRKNEIIDFIENQLTKFNSVKEVNKHSHSIKYNTSNSLPYEYECILSDCKSFLLSNEDYKALVFPILLVQDKIFEIKDLLNVLYKDEEKQNVQFLKNLYSNIDIST